MGRPATKAADNIYFKCRKLAALDEPRLESREGAAEMLGIHPTTLADYELGNVKFIPVESVVRMAELYKAPQLKTIYCSTECPIGAGCCLPKEMPRIEFVVLDLLGKLQAGKVEQTKAELVEIAKDGRVDQEEKKRLFSIVEELGELMRDIVSLKMIEAQAGG